jgi:hypothetical protein
MKSQVPWQEVVTNVLKQFWDYTSGSSGSTPSLVRIQPCPGQNLVSLVQADSSPTLSATGEPAQTTTGMWIAKVKQRRCPDFVRIARLVGMRGPISPKKVEIAGYHRNLLQLKQPQPERVGGVKAELPGYLERSCRGD